MAVLSDLKRSSNVDLSQSPEYAHLTRTVHIDLILKETAGLIAKIAKIQKEIIKNFLIQPPEKRDFTLLSAALKPELDKIRKSHLDDLDSLLTTLKTCTKVDKPLLNEKQSLSLKKTFSKTIELTLQLFEDEMTATPLTDLDAFRTHLHQRIVLHRHTSQQTLQHLKITSRMHHLLLEREQVTIMRHNLFFPLITDVWIASQIGAVDYLQQQISQLKPQQVPAFVNQVNREGFTPLHIAALHGQSEVIQWLLAHQADHRICDKNGNQAIHLAAIRGDIDNVFALNPFMQSQYDPAGEKGRTALHLAVLHTQKKLALRLLANGVCVNAQTHKEDGSQTSLHMAIIAQNTSMFSLLLDRKELDVNIQDAQEFPPFYYAFVIGSIEMLTAITQHPTYRFRPYISKAIPILLASLKNETIPSPHKKKLQTFLYDLISFHVTKKDIVKEPPSMA